MLRNLLAKSGHAVKWIFLGVMLAFGSSWAVAQTTDGELWKWVGLDPDGNTVKIDPKNNAVVATPGKGIFDVRLSGTSSDIGVMPPDTGYADGFVEQRDNRIVFDEVTLEQGDVLLRKIHVHSLVVGNVDSCRFFFAKESTGQRFAQLRAPDSGNSDRVIEATHQLSLGSGVVIQAGEQVRVDVDRATNGFDSLCRGTVVFYFDRLS